MTSQTMKAFAINLKLFNTMQHCSLLGQFWTQQKENCKGEWNLVIGCMGSWVGWSAK